MPSQKDLHLVRGELAPGRLSLATGASGYAIWVFLKQGSPKMDGRKGKILLKWMFGWGTRISGNIHVGCLGYRMAVEEL